LQRATDELTQASYKIAETLYKQQPTGSSNSNSSAPEGTPENPIEPEITED
jgi:hypothetical protein